MVTNVGESVAAACEKHKADITIIFSGHVIVLYIFARTFSLQLHSSVSCSVIVLVCVYLCVSKPFTYKQVQKSSQCYLARQLYRFFLFLFFLIIGKSYYSETTKRTCKFHTKSPA